MSNIKQQKFYWLKLTKDFFSKEEVKLIEKEEDGEKYICFYLKILLMSVNSDGVLMLKEDIPYNLKMLSACTDTDIEIVEKAMELLVLYKLVYIREDKVFCLTEIVNMTGAESTHAATKRKQREGSECEEGCEVDEVKEGKKRSHKRSFKKEVKSDVNENINGELEDNEKTLAGHLVDNEKTLDGHLVDNKETLGGHLVDNEKTLGGHLVDNEKTLSGQVMDNVQQSIENRDKSIEIRDKSLDNHLLLQKDKKVLDEADDDKKDYFNIAKKLEQCNFGLPSPHMVNKLLADVEIYGEKFVSDAIEIADEYGVRKYPYVKSILETWKTKGREGKLGGGNHKKNNGKDFEKLYDFSKFSEGSGEVYDGGDIETEY